MSRGMHPKIGDEHIRRGVNRGLMQVKRRHLTPAT